MREFNLGKKGRDKFEAICGSLCQFRSCIILQKGRKNMKILVLNGSPKRDGSDCMHITRAFLEGMNGVSEHEVHILHVIDRHIEYCKGCLTCMRNGGNCVIDDDMRGILEEILDSDLLLFSFPLYGFAMPAPLKALLDRTLPLGKMDMRKVGDRYEHVEQADFSHLRYVMICGCGFPNAKGNFEGVLQQWHLMFGPDALAITVPEAPMFNAPEAASVTGPFLEQVRQAGREYAQSGAVTPETMEKLSIPMIPDKAYAAIVNGGASNA